ncbi:ABC transporter substrate-binding protein [Uliginosibacterium sp. 31-16]|uniref:ABC transporter substrate-binding protein n=1 Tax=Uliginosibacterium sp. 31-16 TaxID=3068315 RepID=UPI00273E9DE9|nr:ABC transporter substrate-binding protein [Uliginosibacterium sp. 31-16]MDP5239356.1 ABC transporter substrate-binding protein [Uliginosibacterium sp. 31-16]
MNKTMLISALGAITTFVAAPSALAYSEAPALAALVREGKLPSLDKRLPGKPEVIKPVDHIGTYGGTLRSALRGNGDVNGILRLISPQGLVRWNTDFSGVIPNVAESWTLSPDAREFSFKLRAGMKWSDGAPFTADDILFAVNDLLGNKQFFTAPPSHYVNDGKVVTAEKVDDTTVKLKFTGAYRAFIEQLATPLGQHPVMYPKHYCQQFHPKYNPKADEQAKAVKLSDWTALMRQKCGDIEVSTRWGNVDKPTLDPWVLVDPYGGNSTRVTMKRNPYFWQVDTAGNQLPYIDNIRFPIISEPETIILSILNGQLDFQVRHVNNIQNRPVLVEGATKGGYKVLGLNDSNATGLAVFMNQTTKNEKLRPFMRQKDFRVALSLAMDRKEINDIVFLGQSEPWQIGPARANKYYNEKLAKQYTTQDLKTANELLDKLGLAKRDSEGYRQYPSGGRVSLGVIVSIASPYQIEALELMRKQWFKAGLELVIQSSERSLYYDRGNNNDYDLSVDSLAGGYDPTQNPRGFLAVHAQESRQSLPWVRWLDSGGKQGEEPPASMKKRRELFDQWKDAKTDAEADALFKQILVIAADELEVLGTVTPAKAVAIKSNRLGNVYEKMPWSWTYPTPGPSLLQQWYFVK